jgi:aldose 1-epimerase
VIECRTFGVAPDGSAVRRYALRDDSGVEAAVITFGATLQRLRAPDRNGVLADVVLGFSTLDEYVEHRHDQFGSTVGRYAGRIGGGRFVLDGVEHRLSQNDGDATIHGGETGFAARVWQDEPEPPNGLRLRYVSEAGEMGFPGTLVVDVRYELAAGRLTVDYRASTDAPTVVNLTNHAYWNLAGDGAGSIEDHVLTVFAERYAPIDAGLLPTGELATVDGTPLDFRAPTRIGERLRTAHPQLRLARGYDHAFLLERGGPGPLVPAARLLEPRSGRVLDVETTQPALQVYTGNSLDGHHVGRGGRIYRQGDAIALEAQRFPDAPNRPELPSAVLRPGERYAETTVYRLGLDGDRPVH